MLYYVVRRDLNPERVFVGWFG